MNLSKANMNWSYRAATVFMPAQNNICFVEGKLEYLINVCKGDHSYPAIVPGSVEITIKEESVRFRKTSVVKKRSDYLSSLLKSYGRVTTVIP